MMQHSVKPILTLLVALWCCVTGVRGQAIPSATENDLADKLWEAVGGRENWQNARYFMFSCTGGHQSFAQGERKYLWDKKTGNCRFDGVTTDDERIIVLFNAETSEGSVYLNNTKLDNPRITDDIIAEITEEFNKDAQLLFLPTILEGNQVSYRITGEKLVGSQRFTVVNIENKRTSFEDTVAGQLYVDSQTGRIHQWWPRDGADGYSIGNYKAIGSGLVLPTRFTSNDTTTSITYPIAAALVHIEGQKFSKP
ncbi:hypothetical protein [Parapedobacter sp. 10938]|uniref:hypothetical protein n=1 Tax=Parapedobacter flavus TaxID=3110225 RepID=UPI002DB61A4E|nr:hypothetical protein [Parapedobacter sp. 10938]MEC3879235.1 hypothetical protein [Parapedobacter sp. 10938]